MPSFLHLRYAGKIKQFKWPVEPAAALIAIATAFGIKKETIVGFKDKGGKVHTIEELHKNWENAQTQSFMLIVEGVEEKKSTQPDSPIKQIRNMANFGENLDSPTLEVNLMVISNFSEFEKTYLQNNQTSLSVIFVLNNKNQLDDVTAKVEPLVSANSDRFDFFSYLCRGSNDEINVLSSNFPLVLVYNGPKRLVEVPLGSNLKNLTSILERVQPKGNSTPVFESSQSKNTIPSPENDQTNILVKALEDLFEQSELTGFEFYFLKSAVLEKRPDITPIVQRYLKNRDLEQLKNESRDFFPRDVKASTQASQASQASALKSPQSGTAVQTMKQNYMRPPTSEGYGKSRNKEISSAQEKFIQIAAELERRSYLTEHSASLIKSLILEENAEVFKAMGAYENDIYDEQELSFRLVRLAEKLSPYIVRPTSPLPKKDELVKMVNNLVRKRLRDDNQLLLLNKLILEGDELLYSTFEVFESDRDEEDLLDTLIRIVSKYKKMGRFSNDLYASSFYSSQKFPLVENEQELIKNRREFSQERNYERPSLNNERLGRHERTASRGDRTPSQGTISYFLDSRSKSKRETRENSIDLGNRFDHYERGSRGEVRDREREGRPFERESRLESRGGSREGRLESRGGQREERNNKSMIRKETFSPAEIQEAQQFNLGEALKGLPAIKNLPPDEYGVVFWMVEHKPALLNDIVNDHGGPEALDRAIPSILLLANKELSTNLKAQFDERQRQYINESKKIRNSATFAAFQCFKYDQDLDGLIKCLEEIVGNMPKIDSRSDSKVSSRKPSKGQEEHVQHQHQYQQQYQQHQQHQQHQQQAKSVPADMKRAVIKDYPASSFPDLAVIREEDKVSSKVGSQNKLGIDFVESKGAITESQTSIAENVSQMGKSTGSMVESSSLPRASVSKYTPLLNRDNRADSFKGLFQLKLISSDNANVTGTPVKEAVKKEESVVVKPDLVLDTEGTKSSLDAHLNVIIPPKNETNPFIQNFIDQFYESQGNSGEHYDKFKNVLAKCAWLTSDDISKLEALYENFYYDLYEIIYSYEGNRDLRELERRLKEDILTVDLDNISVASASPRERKRMTAYHSFKALLQNLRFENEISEKQYKTYLYLYTEEDVTILAAYEVYQYTHDVSDFIDTLLLIEKVQYFKNESKYFEDISNFNDYVETQLKIIFTLKKYLKAETRAILEKIIRSGDTTVLQIHNDYKKNKDNRNKNDLIHKLVNFAEENAEIVKNYEISIAQRNLIGENKNVRRREQIESFEGSKMLPEVKYYFLLYESIDNDEELMHSIFEVYDFNKDKNEFIENCTLVYGFLYRRNIIRLVKRNKDKMKWSDQDVATIEAMIKKKEKSIMGPIEFYYVTKDEQDLLETIGLLLQAKNKKK